MIPGILVPEKKIKKTEARPKLKEIGIPKIKNIINGKNKYGKTNSVPMVNI